MFLKSVFLLSSGIILFFSVRIYAQKGENNGITASDSFVSATDSLKDNSDFVWEPSVSPFIELLGKGFLSLNVDFRWKESYAISVGSQVMEGLAPNIMYYHFSGARKRLEIGGGFTTGFNDEFKLAGLLIHGVVGYRYQKKKGMFFRAGFTPFYVIMIHDKERSNKLYPFAGLSLGYSF